MMMRPDMKCGAATENNVSVVTTEEQARAIVSMARRAVRAEVRREEDDVSGAGKLSVKRSLEWFLEGRKNKVLHPGEEASASSSSSNC
ncbi:hypothetical protein QOZ80_6AG0548140 [Eleusine coracana subsp. coracana]|nr:hypothetical protein QOZ80_6AG0548140 [Eleusine coracana subsp. coracana]